jgi:hypothetical protein
MTLDEAIDHVYGAELGDFVSERARLVKELRGEGRRDEAEQIARLRKPTAPAWAVNQLTRQQRRDVDLLLDAGHRLRQAQAGVLRGTDKDEFERARAIERDAVRRLTHEADKLLGGTSSATRAQIAETLRNAAVSEEGREQLARGRFVAPLASEGFGVLGDLAPAKPVRRERLPAKRETRKAAQDALRAARAHVRELERTADAADKNAATLEDEARRAREEANAARAAFEAAERELDR